MSFKAIKRPYLDDKGENSTIANRRKLCDEFLKDENARTRAKTLVFTDEKIFRTSSDSKTELVNRKRNTAYEKKHMQFTKLGSGAADVMVWGYCGPFGKGTALTLSLTNEIKHQS